MLVRTEYVNNKKLGEVSSQSCNTAVGDGYVVGSRLRLAQHELHPEGGFPSSSSCTSPGHVLDQVTLNLVRKVNLKTSRVFRADVLL